MTSVRGAGGGESRVAALKGTRRMEESGRGAAEAEDGAGLGSAWSAAVFSTGFAAVFATVFAIEFATRCVLVVEVFAP